MNINTSKDWPLVSAVMPTQGRPAFVNLAIQYFLRQDYPNKELVIAYDKQEDLPQTAFQAGQIQLIQCPPGTLGEKRNRAALAAEGKILIHFDDDDWYGPSRIREQVRPIIQDKADITALTDPIMFELASGKFWRCSPELYRKMFFDNISGGTLAFKSSVLKKGVRYPAISLREDIGFLEQALSKGARLFKMPSDGLQVYLRHGDNTWSFNTGHTFSARHWIDIPPPSFMQPDLEKYQSFKKRMLPKCKVSCIMPTADRPDYVAKSLMYFKNQTYANKELIIIDDGKKDIAHLIPRNDQQIRYIRLSNKRILGAKRNLGCQLAQGSVIVHWDDDDWYSPDWLQLQVTHLLSNKADITGLSELFFWQPSVSAWEFRYGNAQKPWVHGGTLCYTKELWSRNRFPDVQIGEDIRFLWSAIPKKVVPHPNKNHYVGLIHERNTSSKAHKDVQWHSINDKFIQLAMKNDYHNYLSKEVNTL